MKKLFLIVLTAISLTGCLATKQYRSTNSLCYEKALTQYPIKYEMQPSMCTRRVEVPTGNEACNTRLGGLFNRGLNTYCTKEMKTVNESYSCIKKVDVNLNARNAVTESCTVSSCYNQYGNSDCKPPKGASSNASITNNGDSSQGIFTQPEQVVKTTNCEKPYYDFQLSDSSGSDRKFVYTCKNREPITVRCTGMGNFKNDCKLIE